MRRRACLAWLLWASVAFVLADSQAASEANLQAHRFAVIGHALRTDVADDAHDGRLKDAFERADRAAPDFVVAMGIKAADEPCLDTLYGKRRDLYDHARRPMIVVPAASDWSGCIDGDGTGVSTQRLSRIRELFYGDALSLGRKPIEVTRQSATAKYRRYAENAQWETGNVLYATLNLPANNNNYIGDAGRNNEFEDRWIANRYWLKRVFTHAQRSGAAAVVLFAEGDIKILTPKRSLLARLRRQPTLAQDGFLHTRRLVGTLAQKFPGKVLVVDTAALAKGAKPALEWRERIGHLSVGAEVVTVDVAPGTPTLFTVAVAKAPLREPVKGGKKK